MTAEGRDMDGHSTVLGLPGATSKARRLPISLFPLSVF